MHICSQFEPIAQRLSRQPLTSVIDNSIDKPHTSYDEFGERTGVICNKVLIRHAGAILQWAGAMGGLAT